MLGLIHRTVLGKGPSQFRRFFHPGNTAAFPRALRNPSRPHNHQLFDRMDGSESNALRRSALSLVYPYNLLPPEVIAKDKVNTFQRALQIAVKRACKEELPEWEFILSSGAHQLPVSRFQSLFS